MKKAIKVMLLVWVVLALAFAGVMAYGIVRGRAWSRSDFRVGQAKGEYTVVSDESASIQGVNKLDLEFGSQQVNIQPVEGDEFRIVQRSLYDANDGEILQMQSNGNTIRVRSPRRTAHFFNWNFGFDWQDIVDVYIPEKYADELVLSLRSGDLYIGDFHFANGSVNVSSGIMEMQNLTFDDLTVQLASGDMDLRTIQSQNLKVQVSSGHMDSEDMQCEKAAFDVKSGDVYSQIDCQELDVNVSSGFARIHNASVLQTLNAVVRSGDCTVSIPDNDGFDVSYKVSSGMFQNDFDDYNSWEGRSGNWTYGQNSAGRRYQVDVSSGSLSLERS